MSIPEYITVTPSTDKCLFWLCGATRCSMCGKTCMFAQVCTGVMLHGYPLVKQLCGELQVMKLLSLEYKLCCSAYHIWSSSPSTAMLPPPRPPIHTATLPAALVLCPAAGTCLFVFLSLRCPHTVLCASRQRLKSILRLCRGCTSSCDGWLRTQCVTCSDLYLRCLVVQTWSFSRNGGPLTGFLYWC